MSGVSLCEPDTNRLRFGLCSLPAGFGIGDAIECVYRGREVRIAATSDALVQWFKKNKLGKPFLIVCGVLLKSAGESAAEAKLGWKSTVATKNTMGRDDTGEDRSKSEIKTS